MPEGMLKAAAQSHNTALQSLLAALPVLTLFQLLNFKLSMFPCLTPLRCFLYV